MAVNKKVVEFTNMGATAPASGDLIPLVDVSDTTDDPTGTSKKWTWLDFLRELFATRFGVDAGASDTYVVTLTPAPAAYVTGEHYRFKANTANTGACTVNFNALGAKTIKKAAKLTAIESVKWSKDLFQRTQIPIIAASIPSQDHAGLSPCRAKMPARLTIRS